MPIRGEKPENLTPRERAELDWEKEAAHLQVDYNVRVHELQLEVQKLETKWTQVFRLPLALLQLPVKLILALAIPISAVTGKPLSDKYWEFMK